MNDGIYYYYFCYHQETMPDALTEADQFIKDLRKLKSNKRPILEVESNVNELWVNTFLKRMKENNYDTLVVRNYTLSHLS